MSWAPAISSRGRWGPEHDAALLSARAFRRPVENKKKSQKGIYVCPLYLYPVRTGTRERPSFMINVDLRSGAVDADHWIMRGTALLLSLAS